MGRIVVCVVVLVSFLGLTNALDVRMEKDYDYDGKGDSYYVKARVNDEWLYVCDDDFWYDFQRREADCSRWCREFDMTFGSPYTGNDHPGELTLHLDCGGGEMDLDECIVMERALNNCPNHIRIQCMDPVSDFEKAQPLSGILVGVIAGLVVVLIIFSIGCCCMGCNRNKSDKGQINPQQSTSQQQPQLQQYPPQQQQGVMYIQQHPAQTPAPQNLYPPAQSGYGTPVSAPSAPHASDAPPSYDDVGKM